MGQTKKRDLVDHASSTSVCIHSVVTQTETAHRLLVRMSMVLSSQIYLCVHDGGIIPMSKRCVNESAFTPLRVEIAKNKYKEPRTLLSAVN